MLRMDQAYYLLVEKLMPAYGQREASAIAHEVMEALTGVGRLERLMRKDETLHETREIRYHAYTTELVLGKPLQYVLGKAWFMGREYEVDSRVLIPRPETEELVDWIGKDFKAVQQRPPGTATRPQMLDIGTGSGCIAVSLALMIPEADIVACDVSNEALELARCNARKKEAAVAFILLDFLDQRTWAGLGEWDVIVSNPPYIPRQAAATMHRNVKDYEPELALFVPDADPLLFYRAIAAFGHIHLRPGGTIYCELEAGHATECQTLFEHSGYGQVEIRKDMHGNWRMLKARFE